MVTSGERCFRSTKDDVTEITELRSTQEEADTRMMIHVVKHAATSYQNVVVNSEDTDVFVILLSLHSDSYQDPTEKRKRECRKTDRYTTTRDHFRRGCLPGHDRCSRPYWM